MRYPYHKPGTTEVIGFYELNPLPGSNQCVVSNHAWLAPHVRGQGWGELAHKERLDKAKELGYDYIVCTVVATNVGQLRILDKNGWTLLSSFTSRETGHLIRLFGRPL